MRPRNVAWALGLILRPFAVILLVPAAVDVGYGAHARAFAFLVTSLLSFAAGAWLARRRVDISGFSRLEAMAVVASGWLAAALLGSIPYVEQGFSLVDAYFESMSGFTTTGSTIFSTGDFSRVSRGLMFWRAMTQWLGGMGIIVLFVAVLPALAVAGRQMFFAEAPGPEEESLTPRIRHTAVALWRLYIALTLLQALLLAFVGGMGWFDAVCHAFTTLAAGGFSPHPRSLEGYGPAAQWIVILFMFLAGASFTLQYRALRRPRMLVRDTEFRTYAAITILAGLCLAVLIAGFAGHDFEDSIRHGLFQSLSVVTTTGYASEDFNDWNGAALALLGALMFIGGCAGSAAGGPKVIRLVLLAKFLAREVLVSLHPRAVRVVRVGGRPVAGETLRAIVGFLLAYITIFAGVAVLAGILENDLRVGFTGSIVTLGNIGPGYGPIGPMETFGGLRTATKMLFIFNMWVGRLEVMAVLILLHPDVWRGVFARREVGGPGGAGTILYDGRCPMCKRGARRLAALFGGSGYRVVPLQRRWVGERVAIPRERLLEAMHLLLPGDRVLAGVDALLHLARDIWWSWPLWVFSRIPGVTWLLRRLYARIARNRKRHTCRRGVCDVGGPKGRQ